MTLWLNLCDRLHIPLPTLSATRNSEEEIFFTPQHIEAFLPG